MQLIITDAYRTRVRKVHNNGDNYSHTCACAAYSCCGYRIPAVPLTVKNPFISRDIFAHARTRLHTAGHGGTHSILTFVLQLKFGHARFQLKPEFGRKTVVNQCSIDLLSYKEL